MFSFFKQKPLLKELLPTGYIDIHSHILPGIDDGAKTLEQTTALLSRLELIGFSKCIATPHTLPEIWENTSEGILRTFQQTQEDLDSTHRNMLHHVASEYMINEAFFTQLMAERLLTLKDNYLLIEMSYLNPPLALAEIIFEIQLKGYQPLLAHPERYLFYHQDTKMYETLKKMDVYFQLNLLSCVGYYGPSVAKIADFLLKENMIDFVGSDVHHMRHAAAFDHKVILKSERQLREAMEKNKFFG
jgi:tyrosine-protein phosphatase YwqE